MQPLCGPIDADLLDFSGEHSTALVLCLDFRQGVIIALEEELEVLEGHVLGTVAAEATVLLYSRLTPAE